MKRSAENKSVHVHVSCHIDEGYAPEALVVRRLRDRFGLGTRRGTGPRDGVHEFLADVDARVPLRALCTCGALTVVLGAASVVRLAPVAFLGPSIVCRECRARWFFCTYTAAVRVQCNQGRRSVKRDAKNLRIRS